MRVLSSTTDLFLCVQILDVCQSFLKYLIVYFSHTLTHTHVLTPSPTTGSESVGGASRLQAQCRDAREHLSELVLALEVSRWREGEGEGEREGEREGEGEGEGEGKKTHIQLELINASSFFIPV